MKISRQDLVELHRGLLAVSSLKGARFAYGISKNLQHTRSELKKFEFSDSQKEYEIKRNDILASAEDDVVKESISALDKEYQETLKETENYMQEEIEFEPHGIVVADIPEDIEAKLLEPIMAVVLD